MRRRQLFIPRSDLIVFADEIGESPAGHRSAGASLWFPAFAGMTKLNRATRDTCPRAKRVGRDSFSYERSELLKLGWGKMISEFFWNRIPENCHPGIRRDDEHQTPDSTNQTPQMKKPPDWAVFNYFASSSGTTETVLRSPKPRLNFTMPAIFANSV